MKKIVLLSVFSLFTFLAVSQTPGLIYKPAVGGQSVLDPNLDGYTSETTAGFMSDDEVESEIPYVPLPVIGAGEPFGDLATGPECGFTDLVKSTDNHTIYTYSDGTNLMFRFRLGGTADNSKGYTILVDTDQLFGQGEDPDYTPGNPGFEYEITLRTNFGVSIYDIDNNTLTRAEIGDGTADRPYDDFAQKSIAGSNICGQDYFYDFYVPYADLPFNSATKVRMVGGTVIRPSGSTGGSVSDIGGIDDDQGITDDLFEDLIDVFPPTSGDDLSDGDPILPRAACPGIDGPVADAATTVTGTSSEADGAIIELFRDGVSVGTTLVSSGTWSFTSISPALSIGEELTATAEVTDEKSTSYDDCSPVVVGSTCSNAPTAVNLFCSSNRRIVVNGLPSGATINFYNSATGFVGTGIENGTTGAYAYSCNGNNNTGNCSQGGNCGTPLSGSYYYTVTEAGKCESDPSPFICIDVAGSEAPTITTSPVTTNTTSISGTLSGTPSGTSTVTLVINGIASALTTNTNNTSWTISGITGLNIGDVVSTTAQESGECLTESTNSATVQGQSITPIIFGDYCVDAAGTVTEVSGISAEDAGSTITIYTRVTSGGAETNTGQTGLVASNGSWTVTGLSISPGTYITATAQTTGELISDFASEVLVNTKTPDPLGALAITTIPINEGDASISGEATVSTSTDLTIQLYIDGTAIDGATATLAQGAVAAVGTWTISGLNVPFDKLYAGGEATVTITNPNAGFCESDPSAGVTIDCKLPVAQTFSATTATTVCSDETISFDVDGSENLIVYQLVDQAGNSLGSAVLGDGNPFTIVADGLSSTVTAISLKASKIGITCETTFGSEAVSIEQIAITSSFSNPTDCPSPDGFITLSGLNNNQSYDVSYTLDGTPVNTSITSNGSGEVIIPNLGPGSYTDISVSGLVTTLVCSSNTIDLVTLVNASSPTLTLGTLADPTTCTGTDGSIQLVSSIASVVSYTVDYFDDGVAQSATISSDASGNITIPNLDAGTYTNISITNTVSSCKSNTLTSVVLSDPDPTISVTGRTNPTTCGGSGTINLSFTGVPDGTYTINYDGGSFSSVDITSGAASISATAGSYANLNVTEPVTGCTTDDNPDVILTDPATHTIAATKTNPTSCGVNGTIDLTFTGVADGNYTIDYDGGSFTGVSVTSNAASISASAGVYNNLSLTLSGCVSAEFPDVTLTEPTSPTVSLTSSTDPTSAGGTDGSITLGFTGVPDGTYTLSYQDATPSAQTFTGVTVSSGAAIISGLSEGTYNDITITINGCISAENIDVVLSDPALPIISLNASTGPSICSGTDGSITLDFTNVSDGTYMLNYQDGVPSAQTFTNVSVSGGSATINGLSAGVYNDITITTAGGTSTDNVDVTLNEPATPSVLLGITSDPTTCGGTDGSIQLTGLTASTMYTVNYTDTDGAQAASLTTNGAGEITIPNLDADTYTNITVTENGCTSSPITSVDLSDPVLPTVSLVSSSGPTSCAGSDGSISLGFTGVPDGTYTLNYVDGTPAAQTFTNVSVSSGAATISGLSAGVYNDITITINSCTSTDNVDVSLTAPALPTISVTASTNPSVCSGNGSITLGFTNVPDGVYTINYASGSFANVSVSSGSATIVTGAGTYNNFSITVSGCTSIDDPDQTLTDPSTATITTGTITSPTTCSGTDGSILLNGLATSTTYTVNYTKGSSPISTSLTSNASGVITISGLNADSYSNISVTESGCTSNTITGPIVLSDPTTATISVNSSSNATTCGGSEGNIVLAGLENSVSYTVDYKFDGGDVSTTISSNGSGQLTIGSLGAGNYTDIQVTRNGCPSNIISGPVAIADPTPPSISSSIGSDPSSCAATDGQIDLNGLSDLETYDVSYTNGGVTTVLNGETPSGGTIIIGSLTAGSYTNIFVVQNSSSCQSNLIPLLVLNPPDISIGTTTDPTSCSALDGTIQITGLAPNTSYDLNYDLDAAAQGPVSFTSNASGEHTFTGSAGSYTNINVTNSGCVSNSVTTTLTDPSSPSVTLGTLTDPTSCAGTDGSIQLTGLTASTTYTVNYTGASVVSTSITSDGSGNITITGLDARTYTNINVELSGCTSNNITSAVLNDPATPTITLGSNPEVCAGDTNASLTYSATTGSPNQYSIDFDATAEGQGFVDIANAALGSSPISIAVPAGAVPAAYNATLTVTTTGTSCSSAGDAFTITVRSLPSIPIISAQLTNQPTPTLTGSADPGNAITVVVGGATFNTTADGTTGDWSVNTGSTPTSGTFAPDLNGINEVQVTASDGTCTNVDATNNELTIDTTDPTTPTVAAQLTNDPSPVISGTAEPGSTVTFTLGGATFSVVADGSGDWSVNTETAIPVSGTFTDLTDGTYDINITSTDEAGNTSNDATADELIVDLTDPTTPTIDAISTTDQSPVLTGTAEAGSTVVVVINGVTFTTTADAGGNWSIDTETETPTAGGPFTDLAEGTYDVSVTSTDAAGNSSIDATTDEVVIDLTDPVTPTVTDLTTNDQSPILTGTAEAGSTVTVVINGVTFETTADGSGNWSINTETETPTAGGPFVDLGEGTYDVSVTSTDAAGNSTSDGTTNELIIDLTDPSIPTVDALTTTDQSPVLTGMAEANSTVTVVVNGVTFETTADGSGNWSINTETDTPTAGGPFTDLAEGSYEVVVTSTDEAGNSTSDATSNELEIDLTDPVTPVINPLTTNDPTPVLTGTAESGSTVTIVINGVTFETNADGSGNWSIDTETDIPTAGGPFTDLGEGDYDVSVTSTDEAGNTSTDATTNELTIDLTDPAIPTVNTLSTNDQTPVLTGAAEAGSTVTVVVNGVEFQTTADGSGNWSINTETDTPTAGGPFTDLSEGTYEVAVTSTDAAGNSASDATTNELEIDLTDPVVPTVSSLTTNDTTPVISGTGEPGSIITFTIGGATYSVVVDGSGNWSVDTETATPISGTFTPLSEGTYDISLTSTDAAGNTSIDATTNELVIDLTAPATPTVVSQTTNDTTPILTGTAEAGSTITVVVAGATYTTTADGSGNWTVNTEVATPTSGTFNPDTNGTNEVVVTSTDAAGNSTSDASTGELIIDTTDPAVPTVVSQTTSDATPVISGTAEAGSTVVVTVGGATYTTTADGSGNWSIDTETETPTSGTFNPNTNGANEVVVTSTDNAGNTSTDTTSDELVIDTTAPVVPTINSQVTNDTSPVITGTTGTGSALPAGETLTVSVNGATYTVTPDASGNWSLNLETATPTSGTLGSFVDGTTYQVVATVTDAVGNSTSDATSGELIIDTSAPSTPTVTDLTVCEGTDPVVNGTTGSGAALNAGETLTVQLNGATYNPVPDASGNWSVDTNADTPSGGTLGAFTGGSDYTIIATVTDSGGNDASSTGTLSIVSIPTITLVNSASPASCAGADGSISLSFANVANGTYPLSYVDGASSVQTFTNVNISGGAATITGLTAGVYNDITIDISGCVSTENIDVILNDPAIPTISITGSADPATCGGNGSISLAFTNVADGVYSLDYATGTFTNVSVSGGAATISTVQGTYTDLSITVSGCTSTDDPDVTLSDPTTATIVQGTISDPTTCSGIDGSIQLTGLEVSITYTVSYEDDGSPVTTSISSDASGNLLISGLNAGNYSNIQVTASGCTSNTLTGPIALSDPAAATISLNGSSNATTCGGTEGTIVLDGLTASTAYTVNYDANGVGVSTSIASDGAGLLTITGLGNGNYTDIQVTESGCASNVIAGPVAIADPAPPAISTTVGTDPSSCAATDGTIDLNGLNDALTYDVFYDFGGSTTNLTGQTPSGGTITISGLNAGTYTTVGVTRTSDGCQSNIIPTIVLNPPDIELGTIENASTCSGMEGSIEITGLAANTAYEINYKLDGVDATALNITSNGDGEYVIASLGAGAYTEINVTNSGCVSNDLSITLTEPTAPTVSLGTVSNATTCSGTDGSIQLTGLNASTSYTVEYTGSSLVSTTLGTDGSGNLLISGLSAGTYSNISVILNGCESNIITTAVINDPASPAITLGANPDVCLGEITASLSFSGLSGAPDQYTIDFDATAEAQGFIDITNASLGSSPINLSIPASANAGTYNATLVVTNSGTGCSSTVAGFTIDINNLPSVPTVNVLVTNNISPTITGTADAGNNVTVVVAGATFVTTADGSGNWSVNTASPTSGSFNPNTNGVNEVQVTAENGGCEQVDNSTNELTIDTTAPNVPIVFSQITSDISPVIRGTAEPGSTVTVVVGGATYTVIADGSGNWSVDTETATPTSGTFNPNVSGVNEVQVTATDAAGNSTSDTTTGELTILSGDSDGDGIPDLDEDINGDGDPTNDDSDGDGIPDYLDEDDDGDGILTKDEDLDGDGDPTNDDCDGDGIPNYLDTDPCDTDGDGVNDDDEDTDGDGNPYNDDCDGDGIPNFQDPDPCDTDGDGINDDDEDTDGDGNPYNDDCDGDGIPNFLDPDSCDTDGDGENDEEEDTNGDGNPYNDDCDGDGIPNFQDADPCTVGVTPMKGFSPEGNGENDFFYIEGIEDYPNNSVQLYNRWGNKLFEVDGYNNQDKVWRGESSFGLIPGQKEVPEGTYFYLIDLGDGSKPLSGFVVIRR